MKILRRILPPALLLALCLGVTACGSTSNEQDPAVDTAVESDGICACENQADTPYCPTCGKQTAVYDQFWNCESCGTQGNSLDFCPVCGEGRPVIAEETAPESEEDLGPAFSPARISYSLRMTLLGMGMVFAVLALLWLLLAIFAAIFGEKHKNKKKDAAEPVPVTPDPVLTPTPASTDPDPATVAAITAAVAAAIESDPALSEQFAGGFRVVSFRKKNGKSSWNH